MNDLVKGFHGSDEPCPVFSECVIGYRTWRVNDWVLSPTAIGPPWRPGPNVAVCHAQQYEQIFPTATLTAHALPAPAPGPHSPPGVECECGLYAMHKTTNVPPSLVALKDHVIGAVAAWGNLRVHHNGFRAERAQIVVLSYRDDAERERLREIAATYRCELVPRGQLEAAASKYGAPLPANAVPEMQARPEYDLARMLAPRHTGVSLSAAIAAIDREIEHKRAKPRFWRWWALYTAWLISAYVIDYPDALSASVVIGYIVWFVVWFVRTVRWHNRGR